MTDTYSIYYERSDNATTVTDCTLLNVVTYLLYLQENQILTHEDYLEIRDSEGEHIHNAIDYIDTHVEFEVSDQSDVYPSDFVNALYSIDFNLKVSYRLRDTEEWTIYYND